MRLIDADALKEEICKRYRHFSQRLAISSVFEEIKKAPSLDAVLVTRCKDCKHRPKGTGANHDLEFPDDVCPCQCADDDWYSWKPNDYWFCADGERGDE